MKTGCWETKNHSSFKIGGALKTALFPESLDELADMLKNEKYDYVLGNCTNILFSSDYIDKTVIFTDKLNNIEINGNRVKVLCGAKGAQASRLCRDNSLSGFEFLIGLPGSFGGMLCMNASAHNQAVSDCFVSADVYNLETNSVITLKKENLGFRYRNSDIQSKQYTVLSAEFELKKDSIDNINERMQQNLDFRKEHQPLNYPNAGSVFKNPENNSAGRLLDLCGLKGENCGGAQVFEYHANFIVNKNNASSKDVLKLMHIMFSKVYDNYKIKLTPEIKYIGSNTEEIEIWNKITQT